MYVRMHVCVYACMYRVDGYVQVLCWCEGVLVVMYAGRKARMHARMFVGS